MQKAVSICVRTLARPEGEPRAVPPPTPWAVGRFFFTRVYKADRMQISSGLITRHAYYMRSRIARNANRKPIYLAGDKKRLSLIRRSPARLVYEFSQAPMLGRYERADRAIEASRSGGRKALSIYLISSTIEFE